VEIIFSNNNFAYNYVNFMGVVSIIGGKFSDIDSKYSSNCGILGGTYYL